mgnify:CR=1 FL=1
MGTSVSYRLHDAAAPIWEACLKHPFVTGIGDVRHQLQIVEPGLGVLDQLQSRLGSAALNLEAANGACGLGSQADVAHDVNASLDNCANGINNSSAAFQLNAVAVGLFGQAGSVVDSLLDALVVGAEGHIADDEGVGSALDDGLDVMDHVLHGDGDSAVIAQHDHAQRVADQNDLVIALVNDGSGGVVVSSDEGELTALFLVLLEVQDSHLFLIAHKKTPLS